MNILGIETSCDETACAVVRNGREVLSNVVYTQIKLHQPYGGVVPEIASRAHAEAISDRSEVPMPYFDSRSVPHMYTMMVTVSAPPPRMVVRLTLAPGATEVFSLPTLDSWDQPLETLP